MKFGFVFVLYNTPPSERERLTKEVKNLLIQNIEVCFIDNTNTNRGYAEGVNKGIRILQRKSVDVFVIANPDISIASLKKKDFFDLIKNFDISSFTMHQNNKNYYCGELDKNRLSSYLETTSPKSDFANCTYVTGSLMIIHKDVINTVGYFDESYFMYYEDVEFCIRAKDYGFKVGINTKKHYVHFELSKSNKYKDKLLFKSWVKFFIKHSNTKQKLKEFLLIPRTLANNWKNLL